MGLWNTLRDAARSIFEHGGYTMLLIAAVSLAGGGLILWIALSYGSRWPQIQRMDLYERLVWRLRATDGLQRSHLYLRYILILAGIAPMLGLFGTVIGIIEAFASIGNQDVAQVDSLAGAISKALIATQGGLIVALGLIAGHSMVRSIVLRRERELEAC
jgi:hypothetical protein